MESYQGESGVSKYKIMRDLGISNEYRVVVHRLHDRVRAKIITSDEMSECVWE